MTTREVHGSCEPEFSAVAEEFARNFADRGEVGASVHVVVDGRVAVDLWAGTTEIDGGRAWDGDTMTVTHSATKGATALCAHLLVDRGELDLDAPVGDYWPEFAINGKERATVRMMLDHSVGVPAIRAPLPKGAAHDWDTMCGAVAAEAPWWEPGTRSGYHLLTFGWTVGELVRRVSGRSVGTFFREEIAEPADADFWIGLPESEDPRFAPIIAYQPPRGAPRTRFVQAIIDDRDGIQGLGWFNQGDWNANSRASRAAEIPAANGVGSAWGLAAFYAPLAAGGAGLISADAVHRMGEVAVATGDDMTLKIPTRFSLGFMKSMDNRRRPETDPDSVVLSSAAFGHVGAGGSLGFVDPEAGFSFGYVMNKMGPGVLLNDRGQSLVDATYRSLGFRNNDPGVWVR